MNLKEQMEKDLNDSSKKPNFSPKKQCGKIRFYIYKYISELLSRDLKSFEHDQLKEMITKHDEALTKQFKEYKIQINGLTKTNQKLKKRCLELETKKA